jgi:hypothetical protein
LTKTLEIVMSKVFFLSYARPRIKDPEALAGVDEFYELLSKRVRRLISGAADVGFRDSCSIEAGTPDWQATLTSELAARPVGVVLLSPDYLHHDRPWCKWEFSFIKSRNEELAAIASPNSEDRPQLMLAIDWVKANPNDIPPNVLGVTQMVSDSLAEGYPDRYRDAIRFVCETGLLDTIEEAAKGVREASQAYTQFLYVLSRYIVKQWRRWQTCDLPQVSRPPAFNPIDRWVPPQQTSSAKPPIVRPDGRRRAFVLYFAAKPEEVTPARMWRYEEAGEYDWKPFARSAQDGGNSHVSAFLKGKGLDDFDFKEWQFDWFTAFQKTAQSRAGKRYPVLLILDPWTVTRLQRYQNILKKVASTFDAKVYLAPIVVWNLNDPDIKPLLPEFDRNVSVFFQHTRWENIDESDDIRQKVADIVTNLQGKIRKAHAASTADQWTTPPRISCS